MVVLDATIVNIALPSAQDDLGFSDDSRQWVITAYALAFGSLLLLGGRLGDLFGRKRTFIVGLLGFAVASALGGAARSFGVLVGARAAAGRVRRAARAGRAALLTTTFTDPAERGKAFGDLRRDRRRRRRHRAPPRRRPHRVPRLALVPVRQPRSSPSRPRSRAVAPARHRRAPGRAPAPRPARAPSRPSVGLFALVYGFSQRRDRGLGRPADARLARRRRVAAGRVRGSSARAAHPLLPLRVVLDRNRGGSYLAVAIAGAGMFGVFLFLTYYLQLTLGFSPIQTGLAFLPMIARSWSARRISTTRLLPRFGPKPLIAAGMLLAAAGMLLLTQLDGRLELRDRRPARPALTRRSASASIFAPAMQHGHPRRRHRGRGRRLGDGQHDPAGRRVDRHGAAEHARRSAATTTWRQAPSGSAGAGRGPRLHDRVLVVGGVFAVGAVVAARCCARASRRRRASRRTRSRRSPTDAPRTPTRRAARAAPSRRPAPSGLYTDSTVAVASAATPRPRRRADLRRRGRRAPCPARADTERADDDESDDEQQLGGDPRRTQDPPLRAQPERQARQERGEAQRDAEGERGHLEHRTQAWARRGRRRRRPEGDRQEAGRPPSSPTDTMMCVVSTARGRPG